MNHHPRYFDAVHESGHCVTALAFGCRVALVDIHRVDDRVGICRFELRDDMPVVERVAIDLAGLEATRQAMMYRGHAYMIGSGSDIRSAARLLHRQPNSDAVLAEAKALARRVVGDNWGAVARIAERLLTHGVVSGPLAQAIYLSHNAARKKRISA